MTGNLHPDTGTPCKATTRACPKGFSESEHLTAEEFARLEVERDMDSFEQHSGLTDEAMDEIAASYDQSEAQTDLAAKRRQDLDRERARMMNDGVFIDFDHDPEDKQEQLQELAARAEELREDFAHQENLDELDHLDIKMVREPGEFPYSEVRSSGGKNLGTVMRRDGVFIAAVHNGRAPKNIGDAYEDEDEAMLALIENDGQGQAQDAPSSSFVVENDDETTFHEEGWVESGPRFPGVSVQLSGQDGNAFGILGKVQRELRRAGASEDEVSEFHREATSGDYDHLLQTVFRWVEVD